MKFLKQWLRWFFYLTPEVEAVKDNKERENMARLIEIDGRYALVNNGEVIRTYSRRRDAIRGADRLGLAVA